jgi:serine/threonine-protein kinase
MMNEGAGAGGDGGGNGGGEGGNGGGGEGNGGSGGDGSAVVPPSSNAYFTSTMFFETDVTDSPASATSAQQIAALQSEGGWGNDNKFQIDFSIVVLTADASTPKKTFTENGDWSSPDCDQEPMPVPAVGNVEGETGYACTGGGDCHLLVFDAPDQKLYEMWEADIESDSFTAGCLAVWNTSEAYGPTLRGDQCTSADAAGLTISPLLFTADEVASGSIDHAIRYVRPATHSTKTTGTSSAPNYGVQLRLRADYPIDSLPSAGAKVVARALQKYGMYQADGGNIALTAEDDTYSTAKWDGMLSPQDLAALQVTDFDVIDNGPAIPLTWDCVRN